MKLTHGQKKYIRRHYRTVTLDEMSQKLSLSRDSIVSYLSQTGKKTTSQETEVATTKKQNDFLSAGFSLRSWMSRHYVYFVALFLLIALVFANSLFNAFVSDDVYLYVTRPDIRHASSILSEPHLFLRPLLNFILYSIFGAQPVVFRLMNLFFHIGSVFLVFIIFGILIGTPVAFLASSLFAIHPLIDEPVVWISGGSYPQYTFFLLLTMLFYLLAKRKRKYIFYAIVSFVLALASSEKAVMFPLLLLLIEFTFFSLKKEWKRSIPYFVIGEVWVVLYLTKIGQRVADISGANYSSLQSTYNPFFQIPYSLTSYLQLIFWPDQLTLYHSELTISPFENFARIILLLFLVIAWIYSFKKNKLIFFGLTFFLIALSPVLTPLRIAWVVAERYAYLGSIGVFLVIALLFEKFIKNKKYESAVYVVFFIILTAFAIRTIVRNIDWKNEDNLWVATAKTSPSSPNTHNNLGDVYARHGNTQGAIREFTIATQINPRYAEAYHNLGNTYQQAGDSKKALENYGKAMKYNPYIWQTYQNIASIYYQGKDYKRAEEFEKKALSLNPNNPGLYFNLGVIYLGKGDKTQARQAFEAVLKLDPTNQQAKAALVEASK